MFHSEHKARLTVAAAAMLCLATAGCDNLDLLGLSSGDEQVQFSREITLNDLQEVLSSGSSRVGIEVLSDGLIAREVVVKDPETSPPFEAIESQIAGIEAAEGSGSLSLSLGDLVVTFNQNTQFSIQDAELGFGGFVERVQASLGEGFALYVEARREPGAEPQGPADAGFVAGALLLRELSEGPRLELDIDGDNLQLNAAPQDGEPDGWVNVLGLSIELRVSDGVTDVGQEQADVADVVEFEGHVLSVNLDAGSFSFSDGTVVRITDQTQIAEADMAAALLSLGEVNEALAAGQDVVAWGGGAVETVEPLTIVALELSFAIAGGGQDPDIVEFEGFVTSVNLDAGSLTLTNGTVVKIVDGTDIAASADGESLLSLAAVKDALAAGKDVVAWGHGSLDGVEPLTIAAIEVHFVVPSPPAVGFEGLVSSVDLAFSKVVLGDGTILHMVEGAEFRQPELGEPLMSLDAVKGALDAGQQVAAYGEGELASEVPLEIAALWVSFVISN